jgi:hypothetical protein
MVRRSGVPKASSGSRRIERGMPLPCEPRFHLRGQRRGRTVLQNQRSLRWARIP